MMNEILKIFKDKNFLKEIAIILIVGFIINIACFFLCSITGHCATVDTLLYFPMSQGDGEITQDVMSLVNQYDEQLHWSEYSGDAWYRVVFAHQQYNSQGVGGTVFICCLYSLSEPKCELNSDNHTFYIENLPVTTNGAYIYELTRYGNGTVNINNRTGWIQNGRVNQALQSSQYHPNTYSDRYSYFSNFTMFFYQNNDVCLYGPPVDIGEFEDLPPLDSLLNNIQNSWEPPSSTTGHALPSAPQENSNNNDFQNRLQMFDYLKDSINAIIGNLGYNIKNWFDNLQQKLTQGFNSVSQNIYNGFATLMQNIKDFFGPKIDAIIDGISWFFEPLSFEELSDTLNNGAFTSDFLSLKTSAVSFGQGLTSGSEPQSCSFTLDFSNGYYNFGVCTFSLDWILPFRSVIRLILGCLCVYSLLISVFTSLNTYIGGTSSINDDI